jgi:DNA adenine methylase
VPIGDDGFRAGLGYTHPEEAVSGTARTHEAMKPGSNVPHPIPYQGSKRKLAAAILAHAPPTCGRLVEPFAGSAAISLAAAQRARAQEFWLNDANAPLGDLWRELINRPQLLAAQYRELWNDQHGREREYFAYVRSLFNASHRPDYFLYLLARCVKGAIRYNSRGEFNNSPDNRRKGAHPDEMVVRIEGAARLLAGRTRITSCDYCQVLEDCTTDDLIYLDPPYQGVSRGPNNRYGSRIDHREFREALHSLNRRGFLFLVSYDGRLGAKRYGEPFPENMGLAHRELPAGRSTQATLLGQKQVTVESLYLSAALVELTGQRGSTEDCPPR